MAERTYRIGEAASLLNLKTYVLRFWETEFPQLAPLRTEKGQRLYTEADLALLRRVRFLLHERGLTIEGARRILAERDASAGDGRMAFAGSDPGEADMAAVPKDGTSPAAADFARVDEEIPATAGARGHVPPGAATRGQGWDQYLRALLLPDETAPGCDGRDDSPPSALSSLPGGAAGTRTRPLPGTVHGIIAELEDLRRLLAGEG